MGAIPNDINPTLNCVKYDVTDQQNVSEDSKGACVVDLPLL